MKKKVHFVDSLEKELVQMASDMVRGFVHTRLREFMTKELYRLEAEIMENISAKLVQDTDGLFEVRLKLKVRDE